MLVPVVEVGIMRMAVHQPRMNMRMGVRLAGGIHRPVVMAVMQVVDVPVLMRERRMLVPVLVALGEMEPQAQAHQRRGGEQRRRHRLAEQRHG